jgi:hypothetical protein
MWYGDTTGSQLSSTDQATSERTDTIIISVNYVMPVGAVLYLTAPHTTHVLRLNGVLDRDCVRRDARQAGRCPADAVFRRWARRKHQADRRGTALAVAPLVTLFPLRMQVDSPPAHPLRPLRP